MRLSTEELQYLEISLWKDYSDRLTIKKNEIKQKKDLFKLFKEADSLIKKSQSKRFS